ncbi:MULTISPECIES: hypothetical protein [unclassified Duganella]|uniref:hypothetical protein n=1 Tax=unclassified Duganella TaxID=2636909 RepID=UPI000B7CB2D2|nr:MULTISPECIES: hypothetical protein [unclassified Duganella]
MTIRVLMCALLFISPSCFSGEIEDALSRAGLVESNIPTGGAWLAANHNLVDYVVAKNAGQLTIKEEKNLHRPQETKITFNGKSLIGTNKGEWGGNLSVVDSDGTAHLLIRDNIVQLIQEKDELFVFTGLAHLASARGAIYKVTGNKEDVNAEKVTLLPGAPEAVAIERNDREYFAFLIVTDNGLISFSPKFLEMKVLAIDQFWHGLYPNSAYLLDNQLVIGMRSGVAVLSFRQIVGIGSTPRVEKIQYFSKKVK